MDRDRFKEGEWKRRIKPIRDMLERAKLVTKGVANEADAEKLPI